MGGTFQGLRGHEPAPDAQSDLTAQDAAVRDLQARVKRERLREITVTNLALMLSR